MNEKALTAKEAADQLKVKERTLAMWLRQGRLPAFQAGREWRIAQSTVDRLLLGELELGPAKTPDHKILAEDFWNDLPKDEILREAVEDLGISREGAMDFLERIGRNVTRAVDKEFRQRGIGFEEDVQRGVNEAVNQELRRGGLGQMADMEKGIAAGVMRSTGRTRTIKKKR